MFVRFKKKNIFYQHSDEKPFSCDQCGKSFKLKRALTVHMTKHSDQKALKCTFCDRFFNSSTNFYTHRKNVHPKELAELRLKAAEQQRLKRIRIGTEKVQLSQDGVESGIVDVDDYDDQEQDEEVDQDGYVTTEYIISDHLRGGVDDADDANDDGENIELIVKNKMITFNGKSQSGGDVELYVGGGDEDDDGDGNAEEEDDEDVEEEEYETIETCEVEEEMEEDDNVLVNIQICDDYGNLVQQDDDDDDDGNGESQLTEVIEREEMDDEEIGGYDE